MNNANPLIPQGSLQEQKNKGRARVKIAVFVVLAIHGLGLMALLIQGCQPKSTQTEVPPEVTNNVPTMDATNLPPVDTNPPPAVATNPLPAEISAPVAPVAPPAGATTYAVAKGDTLGGIAKKFGVSIKAITDANPGVQPTKLQIGQKLQIPAASGNTSATPTTAASSSQTYTVKSGDNLTKIAAHFNVSVKALRSANGLKTDSIKVGQKLKIPVKAAAPVPVAPAETAPVTPAPMPSPTAAPAPATTTPEPPPVSPTTPPAR